MDYRVNQEVKFKDQQYTIIEIKRGWLTLLDQDGSRAKARIKDVSLLRERCLKNQMAEAKTRYQRVKLSSGEITMDCGDELASLLRGLEPQEVCNLADEVLKTGEGYHMQRYGHLNPGQQRMNAGNRIRASVKKGNVDMAQLKEIRIQSHA
ncbi:hypothetical protein EV688_103163 [Chromatocurvus halotolerans]|uniref:Uncharacterized protein n=2 Tax=Chromatocurvus halotolerans TaxID=1132028 RepID=A0A4R2L074_9GAMM|nr:hypothetical protein EV688_103163 [Chromatocurvus halotolerans]